MNRFIIRVLKYIWKKQFYRFLLIGGVNTLFGYSVFFLLVFIGIVYPGALFISTVLGILFNFKTTGIIVFKNGNNNRIFMFIAIYCVLYFINLGLIVVFKMINSNTYIAGALALLPVAVIGYNLNKYFVFKQI